MAQIGILPTFDHNNQVWKIFKCRLIQWFVANGIDQTADPQAIKRRAIFLSTLNEGTYKLAADLALPKELEVVPFEDIIGLLDRHFTPKLCGFGERSKFFSSVQQQGETHAQWAARLRGLAAQCKFTSVDEALRDRFVMGMVLGPERDKLFTLDPEQLTLAQALEIASSVRCAREGSATSAAQAQASRHEQVFKINNKEDVPSRERCTVCGRTNHKSVQCRFANMKCRKCNTKGHLQKMCKKIQYVEAEGGNVSEGDDGKLFNIRSLNGEPMIVNTLILGVPFKFEIDSGSAVTAISQKLYKTSFSKVPLSKTKKRLITYTGDGIQCIGIAKLPIQYKDVTYTLDVYVVRNGGPPILGRDFLSTFQIQMAPIMYCAESQNAVEKLQLQYPKTFSDKLGLFNKFKVSLQLKQDVKPVFFKARPIAFALRNRLDKELDRLVALGILKPVDHSEYASPIVPVLKNNGSVRICADYSVSINKQLVIEQYPLPTVKELFSKLYGGEQFTKLDLTMAYTQFELDEKSQNVTCINTHRGLFNYTRLVFGLASAPAIFQRAIDCLLSGMNGVLCLLDDILITGKNKEEHLQRLKEVLKRLQDAGLTLQKEKCEFFKDEVNYLGYIIDKNGLRKSPLKVKAIVEAPVPTNVNKLQSFLGLVNYYRNFVKGASTIMSPLYDLLKKGVKWSWTHEHNNAFTKIKNCLASEQVLAHYNHSAKLILTVDASPCGLGAILSQVEADGAERPISFASRTLNSAEKNYSQIQKEATAIIFGVRRYHQYLYGRSVPFTLRTDHKPLISIFGPHRGIPEVTANRLQRYAIFLSGYNYTIEYIRSADNSADFLSRASLPEECATEVRPGGGVRTDDRASYVNFVVEGSLPITLRELREETNKDIVLSKVIKCVLNGWPRKLTDLHLKQYYHCRLQLSYENGCLLRGHKVVIPDKLRPRVLAELHSSHLGIVKTKGEARSRLWFPGIDDALEKMIGSCEICIQLRPSPPRAPLATWPYPPQPFYRIHIDFLGPLNGHTYLVIVDAYTKWVEVHNMKAGATSTFVIECLYEFMSRFGLPHSLVSDNGTAFTSLEFEAFCNLNGISHVTSPPYHPASNGQAESYVKVVKKGIKSCILSSQNQRDCKNKLNKYLFDYRNSVHTTTGFSPAQLVFGHKLRSRLDLLNPNSSSSPSSTSLANHVKNKQCLLQNKYYKGHNEQCFVTNEPVLFKKVYNNNKIEWCKGTILQRIGKVIYIVKDMITLNTYKKHKNQILKFKGAIRNDHGNWDVDLQEYGSNNATRQAPLSGGQGQNDSSSSSEGGREQTAASSGVSAEQPAVEPTQDEFHDASSETIVTQVEQNTPDPSEAHHSDTPDATSRQRSLRNLPRVDYKPFF